MAKRLAIVCLLASVALVHGCIFAKNQAKEVDLPSNDQNVARTGRHLKQFGFGGFPGIPGIPGNGGGRAGGGNTGVSQACGTSLTVAGDPVTAPYIVSQNLKNCFIRECKAWHFNNGNIFVAQFLRAAFHDCVTGKCDGSVFLAASERIGAGNENLLAVATIQSLRNRVRNNCRRTISYADAVRLGAATGVENLGGPRTSDGIVLGKRDSAVGESVSTLPSSSAKMPAQVALFQRQFATTPADAIRLVVTLNGAHTIGVASCDTFRQRKLGQDGLPSGSNRNLQQLTCPTFLDGTTFNCGRLPFDVTPVTFDNSYYKTLVNNNGFLTSDQTMFSNRFCAAGVCGDNIVRAYASNQQLFFTNWRSAFLRLCARTR